MESSERQQLKPSRYGEVLDKQRQGGVVRLRDIDPQPDGDYSTVDVLGEAIGAVLGMRGGALESIEAVTGTQDNVHRYISFPS